MNDELLGLGVEDELLGLSLGVEEAPEMLQEESQEEEEFDWINASEEEIAQFFERKEAAERNKPTKTSFFTLDYDKLKGESKDSREFKLEEFGINKILNSRLFVKCEEPQVIDSKDWGFNVTVADITAQWNSKGVQKVVKIYESITDKKLERPLNSDSLLKALGEISNNLQLFMSLGLARAKNGDFSLLKETCQLFNFDIDAMKIQAESEICEHCLEAVDRLTQSTTLREAEKVYLLRVLMVVAMFTLRNEWEVKSEEERLLQKLQLLPPNTSLLESINESIIELSSGTAFRNQEISLNNVVTCLLSAYGVLDCEENEESTTLREGVRLTNAVMRLLFAIPTDSLSLYCWWRTVKNTKTLYELNSFNCKVTETEEGYCFEEWVYNLVYVRKYFKTENELLDFVESQDLEPLREGVLDEICRSAADIELFQPKEDLSSKSPEEIDSEVRDEAFEIRKEFKIKLKLDTDSKYHSLGFDNYERFYNLIMNSLRDKQIYEDSSLVKHADAYTQTTEFLSILKSKDFKVNYRNLGAIRRVLVLSESPEIEEIFNSIGVVISMMLGKPENYTVEDAFKTLESLGITLPEETKELIRKPELTLEEIQQFFVKPEEFNSCVSYQSRRLAIHKDLHRSLKTLRELGFSKKLIASSSDDNSIEYQVDPFILLENAKFKEKAYFEAFNNNIHLTDLSVGSLSHELTHAIDTLASFFVNESLALKHANELQVYGKVSQTLAKDTSKALRAIPFSNVIKGESYKQLRETLRECNTHHQHEEVKEVVRIYQRLWEEIESSEYYNRLLSSCLSARGANGVSYLLTPTEVLARMVATVVSETVREFGNLDKIQLIVEEKAIDEDSKRDFTSFNFLNPYRMSKFEVEEARDYLMRTLRELDKVIPEGK